MLQVQKYTYSCCATIVSMTIDFSLNAQNVGQRLQYTDLLKAHLDFHCIVHPTRHTVRNKSWSSFFVFLFHRFVHKRITTINTNMYTTYTYKNISVRNRSHWIHDFTRFRPLQSSHISIYRRLHRRALRGPASACDWNLLHILQDGIYAAY